VQPSDSLRPALPAPGGPGLTEAAEESTGVDGQLTYVLLDRSVGGRAASGPTTEPFSRASSAVTLRIVSSSAQGRRRSGDALRQSEPLTALLNEMGEVMARMMISEAPRDTAHRAFNNQGAAQAAIDRLPLVRVDTQLDDNELPTCSVCLDQATQGDELWRQLPCAHIFHRECIDSWLRINAVCPMCKGPFDKNDKANDANNANDANDDANNDANDDANNDANDEDDEPQAFGLLFRGNDG
jgi:hypothetical protein